jgi:hypothetical protein
MHTPTHQRIPAQFKALSEPRLLGQEIIALLIRRILHIVSLAVRIVRLTHTLRNGVLSASLCFHGVRVETPEQRLQQEAEPAEGRVVLGDFALGVPCQPCIDGDGQCLVAEGGEDEIYAG